MGAGCVLCACVDAVGSLRTLVAPGSRSCEVGADSACQRACDLGAPVLPFQVQDRDSTLEARVLPPLMCLALSRSLHHIPETSVLIHN